MNERRVDAFFYGLFMDVDLLFSKQVTPANPRPAFVDGFQLRIGRRATLVPQEGARSYGMLFALTHAELTRLYGGTDLAQYGPEAVLARTLQGESAVALCYNLPALPAPSEFDPDYAARLQRVLKRLGFPESYVASVAEGHPST